MSLLRFIDRKFSSQEQLDYLKGYLFFGAPLGFIVVEGFKYFFMSNYNFSIFNLIGTIITDFLVASPLIINYFKHKNKYNKIVKKIKDNPKLNKVKAILDYKNFIKGEVYELDIYDQYIFVFCKNNCHIGQYRLKNCINKFELDDIKEERLNKLKKLNKLWKN